MKDDTKNRFGFDADECQPLIDTLRSLTARAVDRGGMMNWINMANEVPSPGQLVLVYLDEGTRIDLSQGSRITIDRRREHRKEVEFENYYPHNITHWMPLPEPPSSEEA